MAGEGTQQGDDDHEAERQPSQGCGKAARQGTQLRDADPASTLEASFDALNAKKLDLAFAVDPLFHRTSAQFDAGGARGARAGIPLQFPAAC